MRVQLSGNPHRLSQFVFVVQRHPLVRESTLATLLLSGLNDAERVAQQLVFDDGTWIDAGVLGERSCR